MFNGEDGSIPDAGLKLFLFKERKLCIKTKHLSARIAETNSHLQQGNRNSTLRKDSKTSLFVVKNAECQEKPASVKKENFIQQFALNVVEKQRFLSFLEMTDLFTVANVSAKKVLKFLNS